MCKLLKCRSMEIDKKTASNLSKCLVKDYHLEGQNENCFVNYCFCSLYDIRLVLPTTVQLHANTIDFKKISNLQ